MQPRPCDGSRLDDDVVYGLHEFMKVERLDQDSGDRCRQRLTHDGRMRRGDDDALQQLRIRPLNVIEDVVATGVWHHQVEDDEVERLGESSDRLPTTIHRFDIEVTVPEQCVEHRPDRSIIVADESPAHERQYRSKCQYFRGAVFARGVRDA